MKTLELVNLVKGGKEVTAEQFAEIKKVVATAMLRTLEDGSSLTPDEDLLNEYYHKIHTKVKKDGEKAAELEARKKEAEKAFTADMLKRREELAEWATKLAANCLTMAKELKDTKVETTVHEATNAEIRKAFNTQFFGKDVMPVMPKKGTVSSRGTSGGGGNEFTPATKVSENSANHIIMVTVHANPGMNKDEVVKAVAEQALKNNGDNVSESWAEQSVYRAIKGKLPLTEKDGGLTWNGDLLPVKTKKVEAGEEEN